MIYDRAPLLSFEEYLSSLGLNEAGVNRVVAMFGEEAERPQFLPQLMCPPQAGAGAGEDDANMEEAGGTQGEENQEEDQE